MNAGVTPWNLQGTPTDMKKPFLQASPIPTLCFQSAVCPSAGSQAVPKS